MLYIIFPQAQKQVVDWALDYRCQQGGFYRHVHLTSSFLGSLVPWVLLPSASHERPRPTDPGLSLSRFVMADRSKSRIEFVMDTCEQSLLIGPKIIILYSINRKIILAVGRMGRHLSYVQHPGMHLYFFATEVNLATICSSVCLSVCLSQAINSLSQEAWRLKVLKMSSHDFWLRFLFLRTKTNLQIQIRK